MVEMTVQGHDYRLEKLNAMQQFHVSRRVAPILPTLVPIFVQMSKAGSLTENPSGMVEVLQPFADGLSKISDAEAEYIISTCLSVVKRRHMDAWAAVWTNGVCMFGDMDMGSMVPLIVRVIQESLGPFIAGLLMSQTGEAPAA